MKKQLKVKLYRLLTLLFILLILRLIASREFLVERIYFKSVYLSISSIQRLLTGWLPFSVGDIIYTILIIAVLSMIIQLIIKIIKSKGERWLEFWKGLLNGMTIFFAIYLIFQLFWGFNYFREPLSERLHITNRQAEKEQLMQLALYLRDRVNEAHLELTKDSLKQYKSDLSYNALYNIAIKGYNRPSAFNFKFYSTKTSLYNTLMNYSGIAGYYNPFTGEAQVNTDPPKFSLPFTICHEMAHQSGISAEEEANFAGYVTALQTGDPLFRYSAELEAFIYTAGELGRVDSVARKFCYQGLNKGVRADIKEYFQFWQKYKNVVEPYIKRYFDFFLKTNNQPKGIKSYNEFVNLLVGYYDQGVIVKTSNK